MAAGRRWTVRDRHGNDIYLTHERWEHIAEPTNHPEMSAYEEHLKETILSGKRKQDILNPQKYRYVKAFDDLVEDNTHIIAIVSSPTPKAYGCLGLAKVQMVNQCQTITLSQPIRKR